jgi:8-oxo-dGTP diphosphatase
MSSLIVAAGAVVWRNNSKGVTEIAVIHRPKYDDYSLPKGKIEPGESLITCAYREVFEETNLVTQFGPFLGDVEYFSPLGLKRVSYWAAKSIGEENLFTPNSEVDKLEWLPINKAVDKVTSETDREILGRFVKSFYDTQPLILLRHAKALARSEWPGDDDDRPLDVLGQNQAAKLPSIYKVFNLKEIHTSDAIRCYDTVTPIASALQMKVEVSGKLSESSFKKDKERAFEYLKELIKSNKSALICSHNPILPKLLAKVSKKNELTPDEEKLQPADAWILHRSGKDVLQIDRINSPIN